MKVITVQHKKVLENLLNGNTHYANPTTWENLMEPYEIMKNHYGWEHTPVFGCVVGKHCEFYGAEAIDTVLLQLEIPDEIVKLQSYYDWCDVIYFTESPYEWNDHCDPTITLDEFVENTLNGLGIENNTAVQATFPYIKPEWLVKYTDYTKEFEEKHIQSGGNNILNEI